MPTVAREGLPRTAAAIATVAWLLGVLALVLHVAAGTGFTDADVLFLLVDATVALVYGTVGAVILARRRHVVGWLVAFTGIGGGTSALAGGWAAYAATHPSSPPLEALTGAYGWAWVPGTIALFTVVPWLVRDHPLGPRAWVGLGAGTAAAGAMTGVRLVFPESMTQVPLMLAVTTGLVAAGATWRRGQHGPRAERRGLGLLAMATAAMAISFVPLFFVEATPDLVIAVPLIHLTCQALFPAALLVTVLRNRLWGIDLVLSRATIAALLTVGLVAVYALLVAAATTVVGDRPTAQILAAVGVVLAVNPTRAWLDARVRRLVYGEGSDAGRAALSLGRRLSAASSADELLVGLAASVGEALRLESVTLTVGPPVDQVVRWGEPSSTQLTLPIEHSSAAVGELAVTARPGERLDSRSREALNQLLPVVASGLALARAAVDLRRARDTATRARLEERRIIRREVHDGLGPWLSGLRLGLQGALNLIERDPAAARTVLAGLADEAGRRVDDVRTLSRSLLPPILDELGLAAALGDLVGRHAAEGFTVTLTCRGCDGVVGPAAAAAYAIASEAVLNAARHSGAPGCTLQVGGTPSGLVMTCDDAGAGRRPGWVQGVGTHSMRERAAEQGGTVEIIALDPGTRVHAVIPVVDGAPAPEPGPPDQRPAVLTTGASG